MRTSELVQCMRIGHDPIMTEPLQMNFKDGTMIPTYICGRCGLWYAVDVKLPIQPRKEKRVK